VVGAVTDLANACPVRGSGKEGFVDPMILVVKGPGSISQARRTAGFSRVRGIA
jgi:hypothetical protein